MTSLLIAIVEGISVLSGIALVNSTLQSCKTSGVPYLLGVPAGFGLLAIAYVVAFLQAIISLPGTQLLFGVVFLLVQTYGLLFLVLTYARRTRLRFLGESTSIELAVPSLITLVVLSSVVINGPMSLGAVPATMGVSLRVIMAVSAMYLVYETERNWSLTRKASDGIAVIAFVLFFIEQLGFLLVSGGFGDVAVFVGYEGRILGLFVLMAVTFVGVKRNDSRAVMKRLGLTAPVHESSRLKAQSEET